MPKTLNKNRGREYLFQVQGGSAGSHSDSKGWLVLGWDKGGTVPAWQAENTICQVIQAKCPNFIPDRWRSLIFTP